MRDVGPAGKRRARPHSRIPLYSGTHPFIFPARADAWLFRQTAYDWAGLTRDQVTSHDNHCPRKILVITRK